MRKLSKQTARALEADKRMKKCCLASWACKGRIQWHHNLIIAGRQSDNPKHILPLCANHHDQADLKEVKEKLDLIMLKGMTEEEIKDISKAVNYTQRLKYLKGKYDNH